MSKLTVKYQVFRVNPFIPLPLKGKPPQYALMPASLYRDMSKYFKNKKHAPLPENGGLIRATVLQDEAELGTGEAICSMSDKFDAKVGMRLAFDRAIDVTSKRIKEINGMLQGKLADLLFEEDANAKPKRNS